MKTSEEKLNEALRAALKRKFDNFEAVPDPSIFSKVKAQIGSKRYWRYFLLTGLILAGFVTGTVIRSDSNVAVSPGKNIPANGKTALRLRIEDPENAKSDFNNSKSNTPKNDIAGSRIKPVNSPVDLNKIVKTVSGNFKKEKNQDIKRETRDEDNALTNALVKAKNSKKNLPEISRIPERDVVADVQNSSNEIKESQIIDGVDINVEPHLLELKLSELQTHKSFFKSGRMNLPKILLTKQSSLSVLPNTNSGKTNWIFNVAPLQTYQILTVPSSAGSRYQNFRFPSALSVKSLGYKFSVGVEKKGIQLLLNYSGFRQFYTYEIAGSDYLVESTGTKNYNVIRKGEKVHEDKKINLLGIGVNKTFKWGNNATGKYFFVTGLEYSHSLNSRQDIGWINARFGRQFVAGQNLLINLGPYAEFSPLKTSGAGDPFFYQPYRVGFSLGLKFGKP